MHSKHSLRHGSMVALLVGAGAMAGCATQQQIVSQHEDHLSAAGFLVRPANTPARQDMLARLPPHQFVQRINGDAVHYVYADPLVCGCLYVGSQQAYNLYRQNEQQQHLADEQQLNAQMYSDPAWNWGAWGPWNAGFGFRYGAGVGW